MKVLPELKGAWFVAVSQHLTAVTRCTLSDELMLFPLLTMLTRISDALRRTMLLLYGNSRRASAVVRNTSEGNSDANRINQQVL